MALERSFAGRLLLAGLTLGLLLGGCEPPRRPPERAKDAKAQPAEALPEARGGKVGYGARLDTLKLDAGEASLARNFYFIFDASGSMKNSPEAPCEPGRFRTKLDGALWAVRTFLDQVPDDVNLGLFIFDRRGRREVVPLGTGNRSAFLEQVERISPGGGTPLADAIRSGTLSLVQEYGAQLGYGEYRLIVVTDGEAAEIPEAAQFAAEWGMPIYAIGLCIGENHPLRVHAVSYRAADNFEDLARGLTETLAELPNFDADTFDAE